jgi:hypothetical protein
MSLVPKRDRCARCPRPLAYPGARFCGAACSAAHEMRLPVEIPETLSGDLKQHTKE